MQRLSGPAGGVAARNLAKSPGAFVTAGLGGCDPRRLQVLVAEAPRPAGSAGGVTAP